MRKCTKYTPVIDGIALQNKTKSNTVVALNDLNFDFSFLRLSGLTFKETHFQARQMFCWSHRTLKLFRPCCFRLSHTPNAIDTMHR